MVLFSKKRAVSTVIGVLNSKFRTDVMILQKAQGLSEFEKNILFYPLASFHCSLVEKVNSQIIVTAYWMNKAIVSSFEENEPYFQQMVGKYGAASKTLLLEYSQFVFKALFHEKISTKFARISTDEKAIKNLKIELVEE